MRKAKRPPAKLPKASTIAIPNIQVPKALMSGATPEKTLRRQPDAGETSPTYENGALMRRAAPLSDEWDKACELILAKLPVMESVELGPWFVTVGDPKLRLLPRNIDQFSPDAVFRRWRSGVTQLRTINPHLIGVCAVELQLCKTIDRPASGGPRYFYDPHMHCIIYGVTRAQVRAAFKVRPDPTVTVRKRYVKVQSVYDLAGAVGYMTKARPEFRNQYLNNGKPRWGRSKIPPRHKAKWLRVMAQYRTTDLLSSTGISLRILG